MKRRISILLIAIVCVFSLSASISSAKVPGGGMVGTEDTCASVFTEDAQACGQDINYHGMDFCEPYPITNAPYAWICWNPRDGWHPHYARI